MKTPRRRDLLRAALLGTPLLDALFAAAAPSAFAAEGGAATAMPTDPDAAVAGALKSLKPSHPRLIISDEDVARARKLSETDATARRFRESLTASGRKMLSAKPVEYVLIGPRLLDKSRTALERIYTLSALYRLDGDKKWRDRAVEEMLAVSAFPDWHPPHFLDVAEMTHAVAIGYDWLYPSLSPDEKRTIKAALVNFGLGAGVKAYKGDSTGWWTRVHHNWNQVCNGGLSIGALAVADEEPELAQFVLSSALKSLPLAMASFAPDGGWNEGPGYWSYTVRYCVPMMAAMLSALGTEFGLSTANGFDRTGTFRLYFFSPTKKVFNYADAGEGLEHSPDLRWLSRRFQQPLYDWAADQASEKQALALDLLWYNPERTDPSRADAPLDNVFRGVDVAFFRSSWADPDALWAGFKGGDNAANHSHLDLGTFCFDALGERWVSCLGSDNYNLPDYFGKARWTYYRLRTEGQNTVLLDGANQDTKAKAPLLAYSSAPEYAYAVADLTAGYAPVQAKSVRRGVGLAPGRKSLVVQDEWAAASPVSYQWQAHTRAAIAPAPDGKSAILTLNGKTLRAFLLDAPTGAVLAEESAAPPPLNGGEGPQQNPNRGFRRLVVRLPEKAASGRVIVMLSPGADGPDTGPVYGLDEWISSAPGLPVLGGGLTLT